MASYAPDIDLRLMKIGLSSSFIPKYVGITETNPQKQLTLYDKNILESAIFPNNEIGINRTVSLLFLTSDNN